MAGSNEGNEGNEGNSGSLGRSGGGSFGVLPDRVDLPFVTLGNIAQKRLPRTIWRERDWAGDKAAVLTLADFARLDALPDAKPGLPTVTRTKWAKNVGTGDVSVMSAQPYGWQVGAYTLECIDRADRGTFELKNPLDNLLLRFAIGDANTSVTVSVAGITFTLRRGTGAKAFAKGDGFTIDVSVGATTLWIEPPVAFGAGLPARVSVQAGGTNTGNGTFRANGPIAQARVGDYVLTCTGTTAAAPNVDPTATFSLTSPDGTPVAPALFPNTLTNAEGETLAIANQVRGRLSVGKTPFAQGDRFTLSVAPRQTPLVITPRPIGNGGRGTCTPIRARFGRYILRCTQAAQANAGVFKAGAQFSFLDPNGNAVPGGPFNLSAGSASSFLDVTPTLTSGSAPALTITDGDPTVLASLFRVGDGFDIIVRESSPEGTVKSNFDGASGVAGTCTSRDPLTGARIGIYTLRCTQPATVGAGAQFRLLDPDGVPVPGSPFILSTGTPSFVTVTSPLVFRITDGDPATPATLFQVDDGFDLDVGGFLDMELDDLVRAAEDERSDALGEIIAQNDGFISYFLAAMTISPKSHPRTCLLLQIGSLVGAYCSMHFKGLYQRARPSQIAPALLPPVPVPGHPAYPSGHSTQAHLMALCVLAGMPAPVADEFEPVLMELADRIARNREIAGLHFPSDSAAGANLAQQIFTILKSNNMPLTVPQAIPPDTTPAHAERRFQKIIAEAEKEWL